MESDEEGDDCQQDTDCAEHSWGPVRQDLKATKCHPAPHEDPKQQEKPVFKHKSPMSVNF